MLVGMVLDLVIRRKPVLTTTTTTKIVQNVMGQELKCINLPFKISHFNIRCQFSCWSFDSHLFTLLLFSIKSFFRERAFSSAFQRKQKKRWSTLMQIAFRLCHCLLLTHFSFETYIVVAFKLIRRKNWSNFTFFSTNSIS